MSYQHGAGAEIGNDKVKSAVQVDTVVAYIGTAPINLVFCLLYTSCSHCDTLLILLVL